LREELGSEALAIAETSVPESGRADALARLAPHLPEAMRDVVTAALLETAHRLPTQEERAPALAKLARYLPESQSYSVTEEAIKTARAISHSRTRAKTLQSLTPFLPETTRQEVAAEALNILRASRTDQEIKGEIGTIRASKGAQLILKYLCELASELPKNWRTKVAAEAADLARSISDYDAYTAALAGLVPNLDEKLRGRVAAEAIAASPFIGTNRTLINALDKLAPHLPESVCSKLAKEAFSAFRAEWHNNHDRIKTSLQLAPHLPEAQREDLVSEALALLPPGQRARMWGQLARCIPETARDQVATEVLSAFNIFDMIYSYLCYFEVMGELGLHLPAALQGEALAAVDMIKDKEIHAEALAALVPHLAEALRNGAAAEALASARAIRNEAGRAKALAHLAPHLPNIIRGKIVSEALAAAHNIQKNRDRGLAFGQLAQHLPENLRADAAVKALSSIRTEKTNFMLTNGSGTDKIIEAMNQGKVVEFETWQELLSDVSGLLLPLDHGNLYLVWSATLKDFSSDTRPDIFGFLRARPESPQRHHFWGQ
jgi:hypothetical protein